jgi:NAD(P)-dependent dehydrogenase (short-subunit alcohol dehydrogenase family)
MARFSGKVVIVTGGALGIGRATARAFADEGARVTLADVNEGAGRAAIDQIRQAGGEAQLVLADVARSAECERVVAETVRAFGGLDVLFNNAGIQPAESYVPADELSEAVWDRVLDVNLKSYFLMTKFAVPELRTRGGGAIINTASVQGLQSMRGVSAYAASKGGVLSLTRQLAVEYARQGIRVLAVCPGTIDTDMVRSAAAREPGGVEAALARFGETHPIGRIGTGQDIANAVLFLASDQASFMTGEYVCVDGGYMALGAWAGGAGGS